MIMKDLQVLPSGGLEKGQQVKQGVKQAGDQGKSFFICLL